MDDGENSGYSPLQIESTAKVKRSFYYAHLSSTNTTCKLQIKHYPKLQGSLTKTNFAFHNFKIDLTTKDKIIRPIVSGLEGYTVQQYIGCVPLYSNILAMYHCIAIYWLCTTV